MANVNQLDNELIVGRQEMANALGVSVSTFKLWEKTYKDIPYEQKGVNKHKPYLFKISDVFAWKYGREMKELHDQIKELQEAQEFNDDESRSRKLAAESKLKELELAKELEQLANIEDIMGGFGQCLGKVRAALMSLSSRISGELVHQDQQAINEILDNEVRDILEELSEYESH